MHAGYVPQSPRRGYIWKQKSSLATIVFVAVGGSRDGTGLHADNLTTTVSTRSVGVGMVQDASRGQRRREGAGMQLEARPNANVLDSSCTSTRCAAAMSGLDSRSCGSMC
jgi:hypothetical protein